MDMNNRVSGNYECMLNRVSIGKRTSGNVKVPTDGSNSLIVRELPSANNIGPWSTASSIELNRVKPSLSQENFKSIPSQGINFLNPLLAGIANDDRK
jgi:hypothetical protein